MKEKIIERIRCPICTGKLAIAEDMIWKETSNGVEDVWEGFLKCTTGNHAFPIIEGVLLLVENLSHYISNKKNLSETLPKEDISSKMRDYLINQAVFIDEWKTDSWEERISAYIWVHYDDMASESMLEDAMKGINWRNLNKMEYPITS